MRIAIMGAGSAIAKDLIILLEKFKQTLHLYSRLTGYNNFSVPEYDVIINFVGAGDPRQIISIGESIRMTTKHYDTLALNYISKNPRCRYIFLSSGAVYSDTTHYAEAKREAEARHRALYHLPIVDVRLFSYFSRSHNINTAFFMSDVLKAHRTGETIITSKDDMWRDYMSPVDIFNLIMRIMDSSAQNGPVDTYTKGPVGKFELFDALKIKYQTNDDVVKKPKYYSVHYDAGRFGYLPTKTSLENILGEMK